MELLEVLIKNPDQGTALGNNFYKIRLAISSKGKGKSGGARLITYVKVHESTIYLTSIYDKSEKDNITDNELKQIFKLL
ncbi:type II toxin-antitoxin system RelE/ParE family toxin [Elizabethkingia anophelis]|uniref:type II toxin-antitoxin system RelE/ParE family toxin n=1 Tax=Elizabethkingia anophelis TaxID=1117645 RepID=UPI00320A3D24